MKKPIVLVCFFMSLCYFSNAQSNSHHYETAVGLKFYPTAITLKHFTSNKVALEGLAYFWDEGVRFTGLYEIHGDIPGAEGLKWYAGPGVHLQLWNDKWKSSYQNRDGGLAIGIDGVLGLDYKFSEIPLNLSIDWQPSFNFIGYSYFEGGWGGLGIRYTF